MTITDLVAPEAILPALKVNSKKQALQELAARAAVLTGQNERAIFEGLLQPEEGAGADRLTALARIARLLRDQDVAKKLRASRDAQAIYSVLALPPASAA